MKRTIRKHFVPWQSRIIPLVSILWIPFIRLFASNGTRSINPMALRCMMPVLAVFLVVWSIAGKDAVGRHIGCTIQSGDAERNDIVA